MNVCPHLFNQFHFHNTPVRKRFSASFTPAANFDCIFLHIFKIIERQGLLTSRHRPRPVSEDAGAADVPGTERRQSVRRQQRAGGAEHIRTLLAFLPLRTTVLEPNLEQKDKF